MRSRGRLGRLDLLERRLLLSGAEADPIAWFVENRGQVDDPDVLYMLYGDGGTVLHTTRGPVYQLYETDPAGDGFRAQVIAATFVGADEVRPVGIEPGGATASYFRGADAGQWVAGAPTWGAVSYPGLYPGIDLVSRGGADHLKYEFHVGAGGDPSRIAVHYEGIEGLALDAAGNLHIATALTELVDDAPIVYQEIDGERRVIPVEFVLLDGTTFGFAITGEWDPTAELIVDPNLQWSTFVGGNADDTGFRCTRTASGDLYVTGMTTSADFPTSIGAYDTTQAGESDVLVSKFDAAGDLVWSTFIGGGSYDGAVAVETGGGRVYLTGGTSSTDFPTTSGAYDRNYNGGIAPVIYVEDLPVFGDAFALALTSSGGLSWSTYLGGSMQDSAAGLAVDDAGNLYIVGATTSSSNFPTTLGAYDRSFNGGYADGFLAKFSPTGSLLWSTFVGGSDSDAVTAIDCDGAGNLFVAGVTASMDFPVTAGAFDTSANGGDYDAFAARFSSAGSRVWATYLGGGQAETASSVAVDGSNNVYVTGVTDSTNYPTTAGAWDRSANGLTDAFLTKLNANGGMVWSTLLGGAGADTAAYAATDAIGNVMLTGTTSSTDYPTTDRAWQSEYAGGDGDVLLSYFTAGGALQWSSYLGGSLGETGASLAPAGGGVFYVYGFTSSTDFPVMPGAFDTSFNGGTSDLFIARLELDNVVANDDAAVTDPGVPVKISVLGNDEDLDSDALSVTQVTQPENGAVSINSDKTVTYTPGGGFIGNDYFTYTAADGHGHTSEATVKVTVGAPNDPPAAVDDVGVTTEDRAVNIQVLANDSDPDDDALAVTAVTQPGNGTTSINPSNSITYTPNVGFLGQDTFTYTIDDGHGHTTGASVLVHVVSLNRAPTAADDSAETTEDVPVVIDVLANDTDYEEGPLEVTAVSDPPHGVAIINEDSTVSYTPDADWSGQDTFSYGIEDDHGNTDQAVVTVVVTAANDAPTAVDDSATTTRNASVIIDVLANDSDLDGDPIGVVELTQPGHGTATLAPGGTITYSPALDFSGDDSFTYTIGDGAETGTATVTVDVNTSPAAVDDVAETTVNAAVIVAVLANDSDPDGDSLAISGFTQGGFGTVSDNGDGTLSYRSSAERFGTDTFTYTASDGRGGTDTATVAVDVWLTFGGAEPGRLDYTDADQTAVSVTLKGGSGRVLFSGSQLSRTTEKKAFAVHGAGVMIAAIAFADTDAKSSLSFQTKGGDGYVTVGAVYGDAPLGKLTGKTCDLDGEGIHLTGDGIITSLDLHDVADGTDILMPGLADRGVTVKAGRLGAGSDIVLDASGVKSLTAAEWAGSELRAAWASKISIAGDLGAGVYLDGVDGEGNSLKTLSVKGVIAGSNMVMAGAAGTIKAGGWEGGGLEAESVKSLKLSGDGSMDLAVGALSSVSVKGTLGGTWTVEGDVGKVSADAIAAGWTAQVGGEIGTLSVKGDAGDEGAAEVAVAALAARTVKIGGDLANARLSFSRAAGDAQDALGKLDVKGWARQLRLSTVGNMNAVTLGGVNDADLRAGLAAGVTELAQSVDDFTSQSAIGKVTVKGLKDGLFSTEALCVSAWDVGSVGLVDVRYDNGGTPFGMAAHRLGSISVKGIEGSYKWTEKQPVGELMLGGDGEVRLLQGRWTTPATI